MKMPPHIVSLLGGLAITASIAGMPAWPVAARTVAIHRAGAPASYSLQAIINPHDPTFTQLLGINDHGQIAGYYGSGQLVNGTVPRPNRGFTLTLPSSFSAEDFPQSTQTQVIAIDNQDDTGGFYVDRSGTTHGFLRTNGRFHTVDRPGTTFNQILGLNNHGQAAGYYQDGKGHDHAYVRSSNSFQVLPIADSQATGINDAGTVVGFTQPSDTTSAGFVLQGGTLSLLIYPGSAFTQALGENNNGQIVGVYEDGAGHAHGFVYDVKSRAYQSIDAPGASTTTLNGINNAGQVVGFDTDPNGNTVGLVGTPGMNPGQVTTPAQPTATPTTTPTGAPAIPLPPAPTATAIPTSTQPPSTIVKLGLVLPLSGQDAAVGLAAEHGAQLAIDQANAATLIPGVTFMLDARDDTNAGGTPDGTTGAAGITSLIGDSQVAGIIGPFDTATALQELPLANRAGIAAVSPSAGDPCLTGNDATVGCTGATTELSNVRPTGKVTFFRTLPTDAQQGSALAQFLYQVKRDKTAYVVDDTTAYGLTVAGAFSQEWKALGGVVVGQASVPAATASYLNLLTQAAALRPDVLVYGGSDPATGKPGSVSIRQQMLQIPALENTSFAGTDGIRTQQFLQSINPAFGGPIFSTLSPVDATTVPSAVAFVQQYQAKFGSPGRYSAAGYDSATVLLTAIKAATAGGAPAPNSAGASTAAQTFRSRILAQIPATKLNGVTGTISFSTGGDLAQSLVSIEQEATVNGTSAWTQVTNVPVP